MENGFGKKTLLKFYKKQYRGGSGVKTAKITPKTGAIVAAFEVQPETKEIIAISKRGTVIRVSLESISTVSRVTQGVRIMRVEPGDKVVSATLMSRFKTYILLSLYYTCYSIYNIIAAFAFGQGWFYFC